MTKGQSIIVFVLLVVLFLLVGFVIWRFVDFQNNYLVMTNQQTQHVMNTEEFKKEMDELNAKLEEQTSRVTQLEKSLQDFSEQANQQFLPSPEYAVEQTLFSIQQSSENANEFQAVGNLKSISGWEDRNKFFLDYILQESLVLEYDSSRQRLVIQEVIPGSYYHQMGLRPGDIVQSVDGRLITNADELRTRLVQPQAKKISLTRGDQIVRIDVNYEESHANHAQTDS